MGSSSANSPVDDTTVTKTQLEFTSFSNISMSISTIDLEYSISETIYTVIFYTIIFSFNHHSRSPKRIVLYPIG